YAGNTPTGTPLASAPTSAGTYTVVASFAGSAHYTSAASQPATFTITPAALGIYAASNSRTYDGTTHSSAVPTYQVSGEPVGTLYSTDTLTGLTQAFAFKDVLGPGGSTLTVTGYTLSDG